MQKNKKPTAILLIDCPDRKGLVAGITGFIYNHKGNIMSLDQHVDRENGWFFMRVEWDLGSFGIARTLIETEFRKALAGDENFRLYFSDQRPRMAVFVSKMSHCLYELLSRYEAGEWAVDIPLIISNHRHLEKVAENFAIPYYHIKVGTDNKAAAEIQQLELLKEHRIDFIVLARYMQVLSDGFINHYKNKIINIHHSFLPAFPGARPYHSAHARGVKIVGATSHYVTEELDAGPIITQDVVHVDHKNDVSDLTRMGRDLEKIVLARAVWNHINRKVLVYRNRTIIFE
jgi:formyltetrahydrofolate deformylase